MTNLRYTTAAVLLACQLPQPAAADQVGYNQGNTLVVHMASRHMHSPMVMNENNRGLGLRVGTGGKFYTVGTYYNSLYSRSYYAGLGTTLYTRGPVALTVVGGVVTGYEIKVTPLLLPELSYHYGKAAVIVSYVPSLTYGDVVVVGAIGLSASYNF